MRRAAPQTRAACGQAASRAGVRCWSKDRRDPPASAARAGSARTRAPAPLLPAPRAGLLRFAPWDRLPLVELDRIDVEMPAHAARRGVEKHGAQPPEIFLQSRPRARLDDELRPLPAGAARDDVRHGV